MLNRFYADFHIHIGADQYGKPVKISASKKLTLREIIHEAKRQ